MDKVDTVEIALTERQAALCSCIIQERVWGERHDRLLLWGAVLDKVGKGRWPFGSLSAEKMAGLNNDNALAFGVRLFPPEVAELLCLFDSHPTPAPFGELKVSVLRKLTAHDSTTE